MLVTSLGRRYMRLAGQGRAEPHSCVRDLERGARRASEMPNPSAVRAVILVGLALSACHSAAPEQTAYPRHRDVIATVFWVGEPASADNGWIANDQSYWDADWREHFGGLDAPARRTADGSRPLAFIPEENPFYFALPYGELTDDDVVRQDVSRVPWYRG